MVTVILMVCDDEESSLSTSLSFRSLIFAGGSTSQKKHRFGLRCRTDLARGRIA